MFGVNRHSDDGDDLFAGWLFRRKGLLLVIPWAGMNESMAGEDFHLRTDVRAMIWRALRGCLKKAQLSPVVVVCCEKLRYLLHDTAVYHISLMSLVLEVIVWVEQSVGQPFY